MTTAIDGRVKTPPRDNLCRSVPFTVVRAQDDSEDDGRTFEGYGAVFNSPTRINSWEGDFDEQIAPGAFRKSLRERTPKFQFDHGHHPLIGSIPIGAITDIHEDDRGLYVQARLGEHMIIDLVREAIASGAIDGMSFRFSVVNDEWTDKDGKKVKPDDVKRILYYGEQPERTPLLRTLKEVRVAEVGPVVWPAYDNTSAGVRSSDIVQIDKRRLNEPEQRRQLAELLLRADAAAAPDEGPSDEEPRSTSEEEAGEHSDEDTDAPRTTSDEAGEHADDDTPRTTSDEAGEHESQSENRAAGDAVDNAIAAAQDRLFQGAFDLVKNTRDATPPPNNI